MALSATDQANVIAQLRAELQSSRNAITALGDGDSQRESLSALASAQTAVDGLERNGARRLAQDFVPAYGMSGADAWMKDAREVEVIIKSLPADAKQGTLEDVLALTAKATATDTANLAGQAVAGVGFGIAALWSALPLWAQLLLGAAGVGVVGFVGFQLYQVATAPRRIAAAAGAV